MTAVVFDTLKFSKRLIEAGFTEKQAETLAEEQAALIDEQLATKRDLKEMETRLMYNLTVRMGGMMVTAVVVVAALVKLL